MDIEKYFEELNSKLNNLSDEELMDLLVEAGIENCPLEEEHYNFVLTASRTQSAYVIKKNYFNDFSGVLKVAS